MDPEKFSECGRHFVDFLANYHNTIRDRQVMPDVKPGFMVNALPAEAPEKGEPWTSLLPDVDRFYLPGMGHWQSPRFHGYFPSLASLASVLGDMLSSGLHALAFTWKSNPSGTELEVVVMDWLVKLLGLPDLFLNRHPGPGGGSLQSSAGESIFLMLLAAKEKKMKELREKVVNDDEYELKSKMIAYTSDQSNTSVERCGMMGGVRMRIVPSDEEGRINAQLLEEAVKKDLSQGFIPFYVVVTLGTTSMCAMDDLTVVGPVCQQYNLWLHVDAAYAGAAFVCPEYRYHMAGIEMTDSFNFNLHKLLLTAQDCTALWMKDLRHLTQSFQVDRVYLKGGETDTSTNITPDFKNYQVSLGRRCRSLKVWVTLRLYGKEGLQHHVRRHFAVARYFASLISSHPSFAVENVSLGLIIFRFLGDDIINKEIQEEVVRRKEVFMVAATKGDRYVLRVVVGGMEPQESDADFSWAAILRATDTVLSRRRQDATKEVVDSTDTRSTNCAIPPEIPKADCSRPQLAI